MIRTRPPLFSRLRLLAALLLVALQMGRIGVEWMDDARLHGAGPVVVHIEDAGGSGHCPPAHALDCAICAAIATPVLPSRAPSVLPLVAAGMDIAPTSIVVPADAATGYLPPSRAPPLA